LLLTPNADETGIIDAASSFLDDAIPIARLHRPGTADLDAAALRRIADMGWFGMTLPAPAGGSGLTSVEHVLFFREVGRRCGPLDILAQTLAVRATTDETTRRALLHGERSVALAIADREGIRILGGRDADVALMITDDRASLLQLEDTETEERPSLDPAVSMRVAKRTVHRQTPGSQTPELRRLARLGVAAMLLGVAEGALDRIVAYAKIRQTFGRPIGAYQAVRHPCADMALRAEAARCQLWFAAAAMKEDRRDLDAHIDAAKHLANEAALGNADVNIQLHGGIGVTDENDGHLFLKHALLLSRLFGSKRTLLANLLRCELED
jgi:alkylation response protein AidB-like acyl-CoA dehydrogenase